jgi:DNA-binding XRE family transcriptional regulator
VAEALVAADVQRFGGKTIVFGAPLCNGDAAGMEGGDWLRIAFGRLLRELREERGLSQSQLALESELDQTFVSLLERGQRQPTLISLFALCDALKVEPDMLVGRLMVARKECKKRG